MSQSVKASVLHGAKDLRIETRALEAPGPNDLQVSIRTTGLCGSDLHYYNHYRNGDIIVHEPMSLGHESSGIVVKIGSSVQGFQIGDTVALEVGLPCESCDRCAEGRYNICKGMRFRSSAKATPHFQGTLQERINHPAAWCHKLPPTASPTLGALLEPLSVAIHAADRAALPPTKSSTVLIFGAGTVGLLVAYTASLSSPSATVIIADISSDRVEFALKHKFAHVGFMVPMKRGSTVDEKLSIAKEVAESIASLRRRDGTPVGEVDAVFECTGVESCLQASIYSTRPGGKILLIGMGNPIQTLPISAAALREVDLMGVFRYAQTYPRGIKMLEQEVKKGKEAVDLEALVTQRYRGLEGVREAFEMAGKGKDANGKLVIKVVVDMEEEGVRARL